MGIGRFVTYLFLSPLFTLMKKKIIKEGPKQKIYQQNFRSIKYILKQFIKGEQIKTGVVEKKPWLKKINNFILLSEEHFQNIQVYIENI